MGSIANHEEITTDQADVNKSESVTEDPPKKKPQLENEITEPLGEDVNSKSLKSSESVQATEVPDDISSKPAKPLSDPHDDKASAEKSPSKSGAIKHYLKLKNINNLMRRTEKPKTTISANPLGPIYAIDDMKGVQLEWAKPKRYEPSASNDRVRRIANGLSSLLPTGTIALRLVSELGA